MEIVPDELRDMARERYFSGDPKYRWNWKDFHFYFINCKNIRFHPITPLNFLYILYYKHRLETTQESF